MKEIMDELQAKMDAGAFQEALDLIRSLPPEQQDAAEIEGALGLIAFYQGDFDTAKARFASALERAPDNEDCVYNLAYFLYQQHNLPELDALIGRMNTETISRRLLDQLSMWKYELSDHPRKKVLMIAYYYPPLSGSGVFRSLKFSKYLPCYGWDVTVVSAKEPPNGWNFRDATLVDEIPESVEVVRIDDLVSRNKAGTVNCTSLLTLQEAVLKHDPLLYQFFKQCTAAGTKGITTLAQFPMHDAWWCGEVVRYLERNMDLGQFDAVYTTSGPYTTHLVGFYLKDKYRLPWIADYRDPWTGNPASDWNRESDGFKIFYALEKLLLHHADLNITVVDSLVPVYQADFQLPEHKITSITNGYDEEDFQELDFPTGKSPKFTITYSGLLYTKDRDVSPVFRALASLTDANQIDRSRVSFLYVGEGEQDVHALAKRYGLEDIVQTTGYISHHQALQYNINSNLLLLLVGDDARVKHVFTGKIFDYLRSGKPILAIAPDPSVVKETLDATGHGYVVQGHDTERMREILLGEYTNWEATEGNTFLHSPLIEQFERKYLTGKLAQALNVGIDNHKMEGGGEFSNEVYDSAYRGGGAANTYRAHYTKSFYYPSWKRALSYFYLLDRKTEILEIGCGVGQFANMLFDAGFSRYTGLDFSSEAIKLAKETNPAFSERFLVGDAFQTPLLDGAYDIVIMFEILEHLNEDLKLVSRIQPGRKVLLSVPNFMDPYHVRCFADVQEACNRYRELIKIFDAFEMPLTGSNKLFYLIGERL